MTLSVVSPPPKGKKSHLFDRLGGVPGSVVGGREYDLNMSLIDRAEEQRKSALAALDPVEQAALGQYFTPYQVSA